jgi:hypothetical protein
MHYAGASKMFSATMRAVKSIGLNLACIYHLGLSVHVGPTGQQSDNRLRVAMPHRSVEGCLPIHITRSNIGSLKRQRMDDFGIPGSSREV